MKIAIELFRLSVTDAAHAVVGREMTDAKNQADAVAIAKGLHGLSGNARQF